MNMGFPDGRLPLDRLDSGPVEWAGPLRADSEAWDLGDVDLIRQPDVSLRLEATGDGGVRLRGRLEADVEQECRRCLEPVQSQVVLDLDLRFDPEIGQEEEAEGLYLLDPHGAELDLLPALREELLLALPEFPLCRDSCRGLCPRCGANRNDVGCDCRVEAKDPRWDVLRENFPTEPDARGGSGDGSEDDR
ncbi:MAG: DUF177 domain-containing protein [Gemmatimonadota bacterium]